MSTPFEEYQKEEYKYIAEAHLKTIETISAFFRYYILLMSIPPSAAAIVITLTSRTQDDRLIGQLLASAKPLAAASLCVAGVVGFFLMMYVISLRMDVILYARAVNAIRKYFYDTGFHTPAEKSRYRVLPQSSSYPAYLEPSYFGPVILSFLIFDSFYLFIGVVWFATPPSVFIPEAMPAEAIWSAGLFAVFHVVTYWLYAHHRETRYLLSSGIGVDIDGVLNEHRTHFCNLLQSYCGKHLNPEAIRTLPVHDDSSLGVTRDDERAVFNRVEYWTDMPVRDDASRAVQRLKHVFQLKIFIFTHRPFPEGRITMEWRDAAKRMVKQAHRSGLRRWKPLPVALSLWGLRLRLIHPMCAITAAWLFINRIPFDSLVIEKGTENVPHAPTLTRNRFTYSRKNKIRFFVEDDWEKASKVAHICDAVFLIEQPYNLAFEVRDSLQRRFGHPADLPGNIIRVKSWDDLVKCMRFLY